MGISGRFERTQRQQPNPTAANPRARMLAALTALALLATAPIARAETCTTQVRHGATGARRARQTLRPPSP